MRKRGAWGVAITEPVADGQHGRRVLVSAVDERDSLGGKDFCNT